jgi:hypothetical protein
VRLTIGPISTVDLLANLLGRRCRPFSGNNATVLDPSTIHARHDAP